MRSTCHNILHDGLHNQRFGIGRFETSCAIDACGHLAADDIQPQYTLQNLRSNETNSVLNNFEDVHRARLPQSRCLALPSLHNSESATVPGDCPSLSKIRECSLPLSLLYWPVRLRAAPTYWFYFLPH